MKRRTGRAPGKEEKGALAFAYFRELKDRSKRYSTDCLSSVFDGYKPNTMHIDDFKEYATVMATMEEGQEQHSYFQNDIHEIKKKNEEKIA